jgi:hypothetical protein
MGGIVGDPAGFNMEFVNFQGIVGKRLSGFFYVGIDYLFLQKPISVRTPLFHFYLGAGGTFEVDTDSAREEEKNRFGVRFPAGIMYSTEEIPIKGFFELSPKLNLIGESKLDICWGIGVRYVF